MRLGELISKAKVERCGDRSLPVYSMTMHDGIVEQSERFKKAIASKDLSSYKVVRKNQLVVGFPIDEGVLYVQNHDRMGIMSPAYSVWDFDIEKILPAYLELALHSPQSMAYYAAKMRGTTARRRTLTAENLCALEIPLPTVERQREISAIFERIKVSMSINVLELEKLDALVKSQFVEVLGDPCDSERWPMVPLGALYDVKSSKRIYAREQVKEGVPFYRLADIGNLIGGKRADSGLFISDERFDDLANSGYVPIAGDILVTARGTLGRCYVIRASDRFYFQDGMITWLSQTEASPMSDYLVQIFRNNEFISQLCGSCSGTTVKYLSISDLAKMRIPMPPIELQQQLIDFAQRVDKSKSIARKQIEKLQLLYDSLAQEYFGD